MNRLIEVRDGNRKLTFHGEILASASSKDSRSKGRWIEFNLYITENGGYVLSRTGHTRFVHSVDCEVARRNGLDRMSIDVVGSMSGLYRCRECHIDVANDTEFCPETPRYWAMKYYSAEDVVDGLYKQDENGNMYLTNVSRDLLERAADHDDGIYDAYYTSTID